jgi:hypothetical protein
LNDDKIVEVPFMSDGADVLDSLSQAIVEVREEILLWIDTALVRLRERERDDGVVMEERSAPATLTRWGTDSGSQSHFPTSRLVARPGEAQLHAAMRREGSPDNEKIAGRDSLGGSDRPHSVTPGNEPDPQSKSVPFDSFNRLDALARLLDQRLKLAEVAAPNSSGASGEVRKSTG